MFLRAVVVKRVQTEAEQEESGLYCRTNILMRSELVRPMCQATEPHVVTQRVCELTEPSRGPELVRNCQCRRA